MNCPLCGVENRLEVADGPDDRIYRLCRNCELIFIDPVFRPLFQHEKERYLTHNNGIEFQGYVTFLQRAIEPALKYIKPGNYGLDFGCGHRPTLSVLLNRMGIECDNYDPIFFQEGISRKFYDFIFATECFEHFFNPSAELELLSSIMKGGSILIIMTELYVSLNQFASWHYVNDETHVTFFHLESMRFIARQWGFTLLPSDDERVIILRKN